MTTIRATCTTCGDQDLTPDDLLIEPAADRDTYRFICPTCGDVRRRPASPAIVLTLTGAGVRWADPEAISEDEAEAFARAIAGEDYPTRHLT